jgi:uncharacterized RDD family membrane protein YckC
MPDTNDPEYVGFWSRTWASTIDSVLLLLVTGPLIWAVYFAEYWNYMDQPALRTALEIMVNWVLPAVAVIVFWHYRSATPGKMLIRARIVDATSGDQPSTRQLVGRYFAYYVSAIPLGLGFLWVAFDQRKQGWHDKLAGTVVVRDQTGG